MKTLDEVIETLVKCTGSYVQCDDCIYATVNAEYAGYCNHDQLDKDALHYLREYRKTVTNCNALADDPLTWDELKTMEGKPVWFEWTGSPRWGIVDGIYTNAYGVENLVICIPHDYLHFDKRMQGQVWQAYRKETE